MAQMENIPETYQRPDRQINIEGPEEPKLLYVVQANK